MTEAVTAFKSAIKGVLAAAIDADPRVSAKVKEISETLTGTTSSTKSLSDITLNPASYTMGSPSDEYMRDLDETQHQVILTKAL